MAHSYRVGDPVASGGVSAKRAGPKPRAVFVAHGMGQQVPFATLDDVARGLCKTAGAEVKEVAATSVRVGCEVLQRLEITFVKDALRPIHIYEAYWAPLTEGAVGIWQVLRFLFLGGFNGIRSGGMFHRFMFGQKRTFTIERRHMLVLFFTLMLVLAFVIVGCVVAVAGAGSLLVPGWIPPELVRELTIIFELLLAVLIAAVLLALIVVGISRWLPRVRGLTVVIGLVLALAVMATAYVRIPLTLLFGVRMPYPWPNGCADCDLGAATSVQPLICEVRKLKWVNVFSRWDILGGSLEFYDTPEDDADPNPNRVENCKDPDAATPLVAHVEFWNNRLIYDVIHDNLP